MGGSWVPSLLIVALHQILRREDIHIDLQVASDSGDVIGGEHRADGLAAVAHWVQSMVSNTS